MTGPTASRSSSPGVFRLGGMTAPYTTSAAAPPAALRAARHAEQRLCRRHRDCSDLSRSRRSVEAMAESKTAVVAALAGNASLAVLKGISAAATGSAAMLAETFHSIADTGNQVLLLLGLRLAQRPADEAHRFGHGRNIYFWAFVVAVMLFSLGGAFAIWEAVQKFRHGGVHA